MSSEYTFYVVAALRDENSDPVRRERLLKELKAEKDGIITWKFKSSLALVAAYENIRTALGSQYFWFLLRQPNSDGEQSSEAKPQTRRDVV